MLFKDLYNTHTKKYIIDNNVDEFISISKNRSIAVELNEVSERDSYYITLKEYGSIGYHYMKLKFTLEDRDVILGYQGSSDINVFTTGTTGIQHIKKNDLLLIRMDREFIQ